MVCVHTTHFAVVLSPLGRGESVTEYSAPQWGQKNGLPSGIGPVRGMSATPHREPIMSPRGDKFKPGLDGAGIAAALRNAGTLRYMAALGVTSRRLCRSSNPRLHADQRHSGTSARQRVEREWYPAIGTELIPG